MKVLMVSWEYPPVVIGGLGRHVHHLATALARRRPRSCGTQPPAQRHRPAQPPVDGRNRRGGKGCRRGAGSARVRLRQRHDGMDVGDGAFDGPRRPRDQGRRQPALASRRRTRPRLAGRASRDHTRRTLRCAIDFHDSRHRGRPPFRLGIRSDQPAGARRRVVAGARIRFAHHVFGIDERRDHRVVRTRTGRDAGDPQRNRRRAMAVRDAAPPHWPGAPGVSGPPGVREGHSRCHRGSYPASGAPIPGPR